jgi:hypothetical protein
MTSNLIQEAEVKEFILNWFDKLDVHAPTSEMLPLVVDEGLVMRFPETTAYGHAGFIPWYEHAINTFFDEIHTILALRITPAQQSAKVEMVLQWQPIVWEAPQPKSNRKNFFVAQTWELIRSPSSPALQIVTYNVDYFIPADGSDDL